MTEEELAKITKALSAYQATNDEDHRVIKLALLDLTGRAEDTRIHLQTLNGNVERAVLDIGKMQLWVARVEGMMAGSKLTLTLLGLVLGLLGGAGAGILIK